MSLAALKDSNLPTLRTLWGEGVALLKAAEIDGALLDARLLLQHALGLPHEKFVSELDNEIADVDTARYFRFIDRRVSHEPVSRIIGSRAFWKHEFLLSADTLDPRPDSETLIEECLSLFSDRQKPLRILDLGTGTGCLLISLLMEFPNATGVGVDIASGAVETARINARNANVACRVEFNADGWQSLEKSGFDLVISNPPYIPTAAIESLSPDVRDYDPRRALDGGRDGLDPYREIFAKLSQWMEPCGFAVMETGEGQAEALKHLGEDAGYRFHAMRSDLSGIARIVTFTRTHLT